MCPLYIKCRAVLGDKHLVKFLPYQKFQKIVRLTLFCALFLFTWLQNMLYADE